MSKLWIAAKIVVSTIVIVLAMFVLAALIVVFPHITIPALGTVFVVYAVGAMVKRYFCDEEHTIATDYP